MKFFPILKSNCPYQLLFYLLQQDGLAIMRLDSVLTYSINSKMEKISITIVVENGHTKKDQTKTRVAPYTRIRNGKKELVKGYIRKK